MKCNKTKVIFCKTIQLIVHFQVSWQNTRDIGVPGSNKCCDLLNLKIFVSIKDANSHL